MAFYVSDEKRRQALHAVPSELAFAFRDLSQSFSPLPKPGSGDWLASQREAGQTYCDFQAHCRLPDISREKIYIQPLDTRIDEEMLSFLQAYADAFFQPMTVQIAATIPVEELRVESRVNVHLQYHAGQILSRLQRLLPRDAYCLIGILMADLYPRDSWNFVFGLAADRCGVFSFCRYMEHASRESIWFRSAKVMTHEISHMFGLKHCVYYECAMNGSMHAEEAARRPAHLCPVCLRKLHHCLQFDIVGRYRAIANVCGAVRQELFETQRKWYEDRVARITAREGTN